MMFIEALRKAANECQIELTEAQMAAYAHYYHLLIEWNEKINLTAITEPEAVAVKHIIDSLSCFDPNIIKPGARLIDVGTGAGFPGLPLKIFQDDLQLTLLDSLNKRVKFLTQVAQDLQLGQVDVIHSRAEDGAREKKHRETYDIAVSRAVARLNVLNELCLPFVRIGGYFIALKGAQYQAEVEEAKKSIAVLGGNLEKIMPVKLPGLEDVRAVIYIKKVKKTPLSYPRKPGTPEKSPL